jgi:hypothetical protein
LLLGRWGWGACMYVRAAARRRCRCDPHDRREWRPERRATYAPSQAHASALAAGPPSYTHTHTHTHTYIHTYTHTHTHTHTQKHTHTHTYAFTYTHKPRPSFRVQTARHGYTHLHTQGLMGLSWRWLRRRRQGRKHTRGCVGPVHRSPSTIHHLCPSSTHTHTQRETETQRE